jgi:hypothetical protein
MKLAVMQPYFFPYLGYFDLMNSVDLFVISDMTQYVKESWINRNRILHPDKSTWQYITVPVDKTSFRNSYRTPIMEIKTIQAKKWKQHILGQLSHYRKIAPCARAVTEFVWRCLETSEEYLSRLNVHILDQCASLLQVSFRYRFMSELNIEFNNERGAEERILDLCELLDATEYVNLPGGKALYHRDVFAARNIRLSFRDLPSFTYSTASYVFEPNLSIIDVLMWNETQDIKKYLDRCKDNSSS